AEALYALGRGIGLTDGAEIRPWVQAERNRIDRNREQEEKNKDREKRAREKEQQVEEAERQAGEKESVRQAELKVSKIEAEVKLMEYKVRLVECENARVGTSSPTSEIRSVEWRLLMKIGTTWTAYLLRFECLAQGLHWPRDQWATMVSLCLKGEALSVISRFSLEESADYDAAKNALMRRFRLTADSQLAARLASLFDRWADFAKTPKEYDSLRDLLLLEQFLRGCSAKLCRQTGHSANVCQREAKGRPQASCCVAAEQNQKEESVVRNGYVHLKNGDRIPVVNTTIAAEARNLMSGVPVQAGRVGKRTVTVLRDTGCNTVVVRRNLIQ
ncbi:hypothetical protein HPB47_009324, partial [Ixodes persulcatus]